MAKVISTETGLRAIKPSSAYRRYLAALALLGSSLMALIGFSIYSAISTIDEMFRSASGGPSAPAGFNLDDAEVLVGTLGSPSPGVSPSPSPSLSPSPSPSPSPTPSA